MEHNTTVVATTALMTPFWLPSLTSVSEVAATVTPILGAMWLVIKIVGQCAHWIKKYNENRH
ncbi:hypothetical protein EV561_1013 [Rhizobium sp. BK376]|nr:hypothetical protein EV561_1013 [Rhizobium sp. BK376]